jgi:mono/diheme cytochrome c family protein
VHRDTTVYPWPYSVARIEAVESLAVLYPRTVPRDDTAKRGHDIFLHKCVKCHAVNRQGGSVGPELNVPKNVTEYWTVDQIKAYVKNPATFRYGAMPANPDLSDDDLTALTYYLLAMKAQKQE